MKTFIYEGTTYIIPPRQNPLTPEEITIHGCYGGGGINCANVPCSACIFCINMTPPGVSLEKKREAVEAFIKSPLKTKGYYKTKRGNQLYIVNNTTKVLCDNIE